MVGRTAKNEPVVITFGLECFCRAPAGHHPIVMSFFRVIRPKIVFGDVRENSQWLLLTVLEQLHSGVVFPRAKGILLRLWTIFVLLSNEGAGIGDQTAEQVQPKPAHTQSRR